MSKRKTAIRELQEARLKGTSSLLTKEDEEDVFIELNEDDFRKRIRQDEFVVDDDGRGYIDYGQDEELMQDDSPKKTKRSFFKAIPKPEPVPLVTDNSLLDDILNSVELESKVKLDSIPAAPRPVLKSFRPLELIHENNVQQDLQIEDNPQEDDSEIYIPQSSTPQINKNVSIAKPLVVKSTSTSKSHLPKFLTEKQADPKENCSTWGNTVFNVEQGDLGTSFIGTAECFEEDGSVLFYWLDAYEKNGIVYLFGKVCCFLLLFSLLRLTLDSRQEGKQTRERLSNCK